MLWEQSRNLRNSKSSSFSTSSLTKFRKNSTKVGLRKILKLSKTFFWRCALKRFFCCLAPEKIGFFFRTNRVDFRAENACISLRSCRIVTSVLNVLRHVLSSQKVLSGSGRAGRLRLMEKYIGHRLVARPEPDNTFWDDSTCNAKNR